MVNVRNWADTRQSIDWNDWNDTHFMKESDRSATPKISNIPSEKIPLQLRTVKRRVRRIVEDNKERKKTTIPVPKEIHDLFHDSGVIKEMRDFLEFIPKYWINVIKNDSTALEMALYYGYGPIIEFLLSFPEIDVNRCDYIWSTPLKKAFLGWYTNSIEYILPDPRLDILAHNQWELLYKSRNDRLGYKVDKKYYKKIKDLLKEAKKRKSFFGVWWFFW